ncbi:SIS domain-containing protein [Devosia sp. YR412]|uniref:MurR/RpiR family transcriptional regulator n=1 Tax=Devosia sp. YR412 TaxID=1881030 RepID=UPI0008C51101|nr:SIS domain-containing protein [Devosia sp. YR412]SEQ10599.1 SIS domain-containing protein [Devosia sp. YR412]
MTTIKASDLTSNADLAAVIDFTIASEADSVIALHQSLRKDLLLGAFEALNAAHHVYCQGIGTSGSMAEYMAIRLVRRGRPASSSNMTGVRLADFLMPIGENDVLLVTSRAEDHREIDVALAHAKSRGARTIVVTDLVSGVLTRSANLVLLDLLVAGLSAIDRPRMEAASIQLNELRAAISGRRMDLDGAQRDLKSALAWQMTTPA